MTAALIGDSRSSYWMTQAGARRLTDEIRGHLGNAIVKLAEAREGHADQALGYDSWHAYVEAEFGDLRELRLPVVERRALVASMRAGDMSVRAIAGKLGMSVGTVHGDLPEQLHRPALAAVPEPDPYADMSRTAEALARVAAQGDRGLTSVELDHETGWPMGTATGTLSRLERRGLVRRPGARRGNRGAYVLSGSGSATA